MEGGGPLTLGQTMHFVCVCVCERERERERERRRGGGGAARQVKKSSERLCGKAS